MDDWMQDLISRDVWDIVFSYVWLTDAAPFEPAVGRAYLEKHCTRNHFAFASRTRWWEILFRDSVSARQEQQNTAEDFCIAHANDDKQWMRGTDYCQLFGHCVRDWSDGWDGGGRYLQVIGTSSRLGGGKLPLAVLEYSWTHCSCNGPMEDMGKPKRILKFDTWLQLNTVSLLDQFETCPIRDYTLDTPDLDDEADKPSFIRDDEYLFWRILKGLSEGE